MNSDPMGFAPAEMGAETVGSAASSLSALAEAVALREEIVAVVTAYRHAVQGRWRVGAAQRASLPEIWHPGGQGRRKPRGQPPTG